jgi:hypothetical protein
MSIGVDGNARKRPFLLGVERGRVLQVDQSSGGASDSTLDGAAAIP